LPALLSPSLTARGCGPSPTDRWRCAPRTLAGALRSPRTRMRAPPSIDCEPSMIPTFGGSSRQNSRSFGFAATSSGDRVPTADRVQPRHGARDRGHVVLDQPISLRRKDFASPQPALVSIRTAATVSCIRMSFSCRRGRGARHRVVPLSPVSGRHPRDGDQAGRRRKAQPTRLRTRSPQDGPGHPRRSRGEGHCAP